MGGPTSTWPLGLDGMDTYISLILVNVSGEVVKFLISLPGEYVGLEWPGLLSLARVLKILKFFWCRAWLIDGPLTGLNSLPVQYKVRTYSWFLFAEFKTNKSQ